ncbi:MAG: helix-turn-helix domain-containing protein, partial [Bacilli bacterium]
AVFTVPQELSLAAIIQVDDVTVDFECYLQHELLPAIRLIEQQAVVSSTMVEGLAQLKRQFDSLKSIRNWFIVLDGTHTILNEKLVSSKKVDVLPFPHRLENKLKMAISENKADEIKRNFEEWLHSCYTGLYDPQHIIDGSVRLVSSTLQMIRDMHGNERVFLYQQEWLNLIMAAQTRFELSDIFEVIARQIAMLSQTSDATTYSLTIQKTLRIIHEQFQSGITLEEIAITLRITPEYLSALFTKEVKCNFSIYVKDFRIKKAKALLLNPQLKMFEIARAVGYPDPKYFSRVFKEATGLSPVEYRKMNNSHL